MDLQDLSPLIDDLASAIQQKVGFKSMPAITLQDDEDNADVLLGKTAYYDPQNKVITVYVTNRHPKDILRSIAHEFIHHGQNLRGEFDNIGAVGEGYAQNDEHLRNMEKQAYLDGNMCFRDWEDGYKRQMMESIHRQNSFKRRSNKMRKYKTNKNNELNKLLMEKFNLGVLNESGCSGNRDEEHHKDLKAGEKCPECGYEKKEKMEELENPEKADLDKDGELSGYEKNRAEKIEKSMKDQAKKKGKKEKVEESELSEPWPERFTLSKEKWLADKKRLRKTVDGKMVPISHYPHVPLDVPLPSLAKPISKKEALKLKAQGYDITDEEIAELDITVNESFRREVRKLMEEVLKLK